MKACALKTRHHASRLRLRAGPAVALARRCPLPNNVGSSSHLKSPIDAASEEMRAELYVIKYENVGAQVYVKVFHLGTPILIEGIFDPSAGGLSEAHVTETTKHVPRARYCD